MRQSLCLLTYRSVQNILEREEVMLKDMEKYHQLLFFKNY